MSWQKCMSFLKCSNLKLNTLDTSNFAIKEIKGRTIISGEQNFENKALDGVNATKYKIKEKFKLKTKHTETKI